MSARLSIEPVPGIPLVATGDDLPGIIGDCLRHAGQELLDGDVLVVAQKIFSKAEGRQVDLREVEPSARATELAAKAGKDPRAVELILQESRHILRHKPGVIIAEHRLGFVLANAGIDRSNVDPEEQVLLLLPEDPDASCTTLRERLQSDFDARIGVVMADSVGRAWRMGTTGMALGSAGVEALANLRGQRDLFGRELQVSEHAVADAIAAAAELVMGEAAERTPVVLLRGLAQGKSDQVAAVLLRPADEDLFR